MTATSDYVTFLTDPNREDIYLVELYPYDPNTATTTTLRFSNREFRTRSNETPADTIWKANSDFVYSYSAPAIPPGTVGIVPSAVGGTITLGQKLGDLDYLNNYYWDGRRCVLKHGGRSKFGTLDYSDFQTIRDGEIERATVGLDRVTITLKEKEDRFAHPVERRKLGGFGHCIEFNGTTGYVDFADPAKLKIVNALTIETWIIPYVVNTSQHILGWDNTPFELYLDSSGKLNLEWAKSSVTVTKTSDFTFEAEKRYHLGITVSDTEVKFYIYDYAADSTTTETFTGTGFTGRDNPGASVAYRYGKSYGSSDYYDGQLWNTRIFNTTESASDIEARRFRPLTDTELALSSLKHYTPMSDGTGTTVTDTSSSPVSGSVGGTVNWRSTMTGLLTGDEENGTGGQTVPNVFGKVYNYSPIPVDEARRIYQIHAGTINGLNGIYEGGYADIAPDNVYTTVETFLAGTTTASEYDILHWSCGTYIRLGSSAVLPITVDVEGDDGAGLLNTVSDIVYHIITTRGPSPLAGSEVDTSSFTTLETANDAAVGIVIENDMKIAEAVNALLGSIGAIGWFNRETGDFTVKRFDGVGATAASVTLTECDVEESIDSLRVLDVELPVYDVIVKFKKNWTVMGSESLAAAIKGMWRYGFSMTEWRKVASNHPSQLTPHPRAREMVLESMLQSYADAATEANRLYTLFSGVAQSVEVVIRNRVTTVDRLDVVAFSYRDLDENNDLQYRLNTDSSSTWVVLGIDDDAHSGTTKLTLWRENMSTGGGGEGGG